MQMSEHLILGLLLVGQTIVSAVAIAILSRDLRYVASIAERILNKVEHP